MKKIIAASLLAPYLFLLAADNTNPRTVYVESEGIRCTLSVQSPMTINDPLTFYEQINALNDSIVQEWRELGNQAENVAESGVKIVIVVDNASFHKKKDILSQISA